MWGPVAYGPCLRLLHTVARRMDDTRSGLRRRHPTHNWAPVQNQERPVELQSPPRASLPHSEAGAIGTPYSPTTPQVLLLPHSWGPTVPAKSSLRGPPGGKGELGGKLEKIKTGSGVTKGYWRIEEARTCTYLRFPRTAQQPGLKGVGSADALSWSRKALGTGAEGWG